MTSAHRPMRNVRRRVSLTTVRRTRAWRRGWRAVAPTVMASAVAIVAVLLVSASGAGQLPPEVLADSHLLQVEQALRDGDHSRAWARIQDVLRLQRDHDLDLPELHYWYAKTADAMNLPQQALDSVTEYLSAAGRQANHYAEALVLLNTLQTTVSCEGWDAGAYFETATLDQVTACLETGNVDLEARNASGSTPLHAAVTHAEDPAVVQALLDAGAQVEATETVSGATPLSLAIRDNGTPAIIEVLLAAGANPDTPNTFGAHTPPSGGPIRGRSGRVRDPAHGPERLDNAGAGARRDRAIS